MLFKNFRAGFFFFFYKKTLDNGKKNRHNRATSDGRVAEWLMAADCKSADLCLRKFESFPFHHLVFSDRSFRAVFLSASDISFIIILLILFLVVFERCAQISPFLVILKRAVESCPEESIVM